MKPAQVLAECLDGDTAESDGMQQLRALLGSDDWQLNSTSAQKELDNAVGAIPAPEQASIKVFAPRPRQSFDNMEQHAAVSDLDDLGLVQGLTAEITAAAQRAAKDAISSSVQVGAHLKYL